MKKISDSTKSKQGIILKGIMRKDQIVQVLFTFLIFEKFFFPLKVKLVVKQLLSLSPCVQAGVELILSTVAGMGLCFGSMLNQ